MGFIMADTRSLDYSSHVSVLVGLLYPYLHKVFLFTTVAEAISASHFLHGKQDTCSETNPQHWVAVKEPNIHYYIKGIPFFILYPYYGNLHAKP